MSKTLADNALHYIVEEVLNNFTQNVYLANVLFTDISTRARGRESVGIPEWNDTIVPEATVNQATKANNTLTPQELSDIENLLVKDQADGFSVRLKTWQRLFNWLYQGDTGATDDVVRLLTARLRNYIDRKETAFLAFNSLWTTAATPRTHLNVNGGALSMELFRLGVGRMTEELGVFHDSLTFAVSTIGEANIRSLPDFQTQEPQTLSPGVRRIGSLDGIPVVVGQSIQKARTVAILSSIVTAGNEIVATVAADHGYVVGMDVTSTGLTNEGAGAITAVTATTVTFPAIGTPGAVDPNGAGTLAQTTPTAWNLLINRDRAWRAEETPYVNLTDKHDDTAKYLQMEQTWGRYARKENGEGHVGTGIVIHTKDDAISVA